LFADILKKVVDNVDGGLGAVIMGLDGIPVETYTRQPERVDVNTVGMEFSFILTQAKKAADSAKLGAFEEMTVKADQLTLALRLVTPQYFVAVALSPEGNFGKARFLLRLASSKLVSLL
jgi:predicted regulator of Ras-like GTPase activity (Roadblock/LC7/MglB family)